MKKNKFNAQLKAASVGATSDLHKEIEETSKYSIQTTYANYSRMTDRELMLTVLRQYLVSARLGMTVSDKNSRQMFAAIARSHAVLVQNAAQRVRSTLRAMGIK
jgi:hypothetical protein